MADAESSIYIRWISTKGTSSSLKFSYSQSNSTMLDEISRSFGYTGALYRSAWRVDPRGHDGNGKHSHGEHPWACVFTGEDAAFALRTLFPYLREKSMYAELALRYFDAPSNSQARLDAYNEYIEYKRMVEVDFFGVVPNPGVPVGIAATPAALFAYAAGMLEGDGYIGAHHNAAQGSIGMNLSWSSTKAPRVMADFRRHARGLWPGAPAFGAPNHRGNLDTSSPDGNVEYGVEAQQTAYAWLTRMLPHLVTKYQSTLALFVLCPRARLGLNTFGLPAPLLAELGAWNTGPYNWAVWAARGFPNSFTAPMGAHANVPTIVPANATGGGPNNGHGARIFPNDPTNHVRFPAATGRFSLPAGNALIGVLVGARTYNVIWPFSH